ncbi:MAG: type I-C CRISPR-associated protein Cas5c [Thermoguttaceae bacterium]|nr:type I-C CRISPR-associated protein Cas5c [Thermoguttaceae bacterium]
MKGFCLEVSGKNACFTRPEMKAERVSYDVITPSAARGIFEAILWKPAILWEIRRIEVLAPIRWESVRRNEVEKVASERSSGIFVEDDRQQRAGLFLRDVKYRLFAEFVFIPSELRSKVIRPLPEWLAHAEGGEECDVVNMSENRPDEKEAKYAAMFERRAKKGQTFHQPYFGCREFPVDFRLVSDPKADPPDPVPEELKGQRDLGWMLYDLDYSNPIDLQPLFYRPVMIDGVIDVEKFRAAANLPSARLSQLQFKEDAR